MPIEIRCSGCGQLLRVQEENAGKRGRCPQCKTEFTIPFPEDQLASESSNPADDSDATIQAAPVKPEQNPFGDKPAPQTNPYASPQQTFTPQVPGTGYRRPHRGAMILTLGILAIPCNFCLIPGICAWSMGSNDLNAMRNGQMDPSGRGLTQAGHILGIIGTVISIIAIVVQFGVMN